MPPVCNKCGEEMERYDMIEDERGKIKYYFCDCQSPRLRKEYQEAKRKGQL